MKSEYFVDFENGTFQQQDPIFIKFVDYLKTLGINALFVVFEDSNCMVVEVLTPSEVLNAYEIFKLNGEIILDKFFSLIEEFSTKLFFEKSKWSPNHFMDFSSFESTCITNLVWRCRLKVLEALNSNCIYAQYVFYRTRHDGSPKMLSGYYIFFENADALAKVNESQRQKIRSICIKELAWRDKSGFFSPDEIDIEFRDAITDAYAVGHLSRDVD